MSQNQFNAYKALRESDCANQVPCDLDSPSRIRDGISRTEELLGDIHNAIDVIERRLDVVLQPTPPLPGAPTGVTKALPLGSHFLGRVVGLNDGFDAAVQRLRSLTQRVEV